MNNALKINIAHLTKADKLRLAKDAKDPLLLAELSKDEDVDIREAVALNQNCDGKTLDRLRNDEYIRVETNAIFTIRMALISTEYQRQELNRRLLDAIDEDTSIKEMLHDDTLKLLYENSFPQSNEDLNVLNKLQESLPFVSEYQKIMSEGIILGSMLEGAWDAHYDLMVANETGRDVDGIDIPNNTPHERKGRIDIGR